MKQRITALDLQVLTRELQQELANYRLQNIQNVAASARQFLLKFAVPDSKKVVVIDCGNRVHLTDFERQVTQAPSNFVTKLRKHLKSRRLSLIKQIGNDRVLVLEFSDGMFYLVLEFFSAGNILLLDHDRKILSLQRMVSDKGDNDRYAVNEYYSMFDELLFSQDQVSEHRTYTAAEISQWIEQHKEKLIAAKEAGTKLKVLSIHKLAFVNASHLSSELILRSMRNAGIDASASCLEFEGEEGELSRVCKSLQSAQADYEALTRNEEVVEGVIVGKRNPLYRENESDKELQFTYDEVHCFEPYKANYDDLELIRVSGYNKTLDKFFSTIESTKYALRIEQRKLQADKRLENARSERDRQIQSLIDQQDLNAAKGDALVLHSDLVSSCIEVVQKLLDQQMDWSNIERYIALEQKKKTPVFTSINLPLNLKDNKIGIRLRDGREQDEEPYHELDSDASTLSDSDSESESDSSFDTDSDLDSSTNSSLKEMCRNTRSKKSSKKPVAKTFLVWVDLALSPYANAATYFDTKKSAVSKKTKVEKSTNMALKNAERKIQQDLTKNLKQENESLKHMRPKFWFEKFFWFVSSEGYLCMAGRDAGQTDMIYYRHTNDNDYLVSSDMEGSLHVFIKNPFKGEAVPPSTLMQAGIFAISASKAWNGKMSTSAWVLENSEISKKDGDGNLIEPGSFNYRGKKTYLPPSQLVMGFGFYWLANDETTAKNKAARLAREQEHGLTIIMDHKKMDLEDAISQAKIGAALESMLLDSKPSKEAVEPSKMEKGLEEDVVDEVLAKSTLENEREPNPNQSDIVQPTNAPKLRGKKAKMKKIATKYAAQDEDEKRLRMEALGTLKQVEELERQRAQQKQLELEQGEDGHSDAAKYRQSEATLRRKRQDEREYKRYLSNAPEDHDESEASTTNYLDILDHFITKPLADNVPVDVVAVFAPWQALNKFKYKIKVQPGNAKKGKCISEAIHYFTTRKTEVSDADADTEFEREMIKTTKANDVVGCFTVSKVKLVLPAGGSDNKGNGKAKANVKGKGNKKR